MSDEFGAAQPAVDELRDKVASSAYCIAIDPGSDRIDAKVAFEVGMMVLLNKPIIVLVEKGRDPLPGLTRVAHKVIALRESITSDAGKQQLMAELATLRDGSGLT